MLVSNFEVGCGVRTRDWKTRYELHITNLEDETVTFLTQFDVSSVKNGNLTAATVAQCLPGSWRRTGRVVRGEFFAEIAPRETKTVVLLPGGDVEVRLFGTVQLRVPPIRIGGKASLWQRANPVRVLLHARRVDSRSSHGVGISDTDGVVRGWSSEGDAYSSESVHLSTGRAANVIEPDGFRFGSLESVEALIRRILEAQSAGETNGALLIPEEDRALALLDLLVAVSHDENAVGLASVLNEALGRSESSIRLAIDEAALNAPMPTNKLTAMPAGE